MFGEDSSCFELLLRAVLPLNLSSPARSFLFENIPGIFFRSNAVNFVAILWSRVSVQIASYLGSDSLILQGVS